MPPYERTLGDDFNLVTAALAAINQCWLEHDMDTGKKLIDFGYTFIEL